jgi:arylsulfatase A-like enzyme
LLAFTFGSRHDALHGNISLEGRTMRAVLKAAVGLAAICVPAQAQERPNILWITSEDNGPHLGCYGDQYAVTPNLDELATTSLVYEHCWSNAPVCAPARTTIISGLYPPSTGSEHMRSMTRLPEGFRMYPQYLREAGYYCTNNAKEDYNLAKPNGVWDESSRNAHWKNRKQGQPFFAIFNHQISHESQIRNDIDEADRIHDPAQAPLPAYHPDTPEVRKDWAQYYDRLTMMDKLVGQNLKELEQAGLTEDTIVFYYADHGSGMPRNKRWPFNSGLHVPLIVRIPEKFAHLRPDDYQAGGRTDRLVGFVDLAPTLLSLVGIEPPSQLQGHAFAGKFTAPPQPYQFGFRGRMDERYDFVRSAGDGQYVYIRNYHPHEVYGQFIAYMFQTPTTRVWKERFDHGRLNEAQSRFWQTKPSEELYDLANDPHEVNNLAGSSEHAEVLERMRNANREHLLAIRDLGFLPEGQIHALSEGTTPYQLGHDPQRYPLEEILPVAEAASSLDPAETPSLIEAMNHGNPTIRYWGAMGLLMRGKEAVAAGHDPLIDALEDPSVEVQIAAAEALGRYGAEVDDMVQALPILVLHADVTKGGLYTAMAALNAIDAIDQIDHEPIPLKEKIEALPRSTEPPPQRMGAYVGNLIDKILADLEE